MNKNKMTYKEFEKEIELFNYKMVKQDTFIAVLNADGERLATIWTHEMRWVSTGWKAFAEIEPRKQSLFLELIWRLINTPLEDREEPKRYFYIVKPEYRYLFPPEEIYLNHVRASNRFSICTISNDDDWRTEFNEKECKILESDYNLSLFEKVEV